MRSLLREAIHTVNQSMLSWKHPKLKSKYNVLDKGGNTTLVAAIVFPYIDDDTTTIQSDPTSDDSASPTDLHAPGPSSPTHNEALSSHHPKTSELSSSSPAKTPSRKLSTGSRHAADSERKFGVVFTGMGDSELYLFKMHEPERAARGKGSSTSIVSPASSSAPTLPAHSPSTGDLHDSRYHTNTTPGHSRSGTNDDLRSSSPTQLSLSHRPSDELPSPSLSSSKSKHTKTSSKDTKKGGRFQAALGTGSPGATSSSSAAATSSASVDASSSRNTVQVQDTQQQSTYTFVQARPATYDPTSSNRFSNSSTGNSHSSSEPGSPRTTVAEVGHQRSAHKEAESPSRSRVPSDSSSDTVPPSPSKTASNTNSVALANSPSVGTIVEEQCEDTSDDTEMATNSRTISDSSAPKVELSVSHELNKEFSNTSLNGTDEVQKKTKKRRGSSSSSRASERTCDAHNDSNDSSALDTTSQKCGRKGSHSSEGSRSPTKASALTPSSSGAQADPFSARSARYSKSFSDIPVFDSTDPPAPMYRSESLTLDLSPGRIASREDDPTNAARTTTPPRVSTPRAPCGTWLKILSDSGRSPFLPFPGLKDRSIPEPNFVALNPGDAIFACSDGVVSSYPDGIQWPDITLENYDTNDGLDYATHALIQSTIMHHKLANTDPDDVTVGALKITTYAKKPKSDSLRVAPVRDVTASFAPQFASSLYHREYLNDFLCDYPKPKDKPPS